MKMKLKLLRMLEKKGLLMATSISGRGVDIQLGKKGSIADDELKNKR